MPSALRVDQLGGANFGGYHLRNVASLHVGGNALATAILDVSGSKTANAGSAIGQNNTTTLVAAANNDVLTALRIAPTFTNGAFTGVVNKGLWVVSGLTDLDGDLEVAGTATVGAAMTVAGLVTASAGVKLATSQTITFGDGTTQSTAAVTGVLEGDTPTWTGIHTFNADIIANGAIRKNTADGSDTGLLQLQGGASYSTARGASIQIAGNEEVNWLGSIHLQAGVNSSGGFIRFDTASAERMRLTYTGNLGFGTSDVEAWHGNIKVIQGALGALALPNNISFGEVALFGNAYYDATNEKYLTAAAASKYVQSAGAHFFQVAGSGAVDTAITWVNALKIKDTSGYVGIGPLATNPNVTLQLYREDFGNYIASMINTSTRGYGLTIQLSQNITAGDIGLAMGSKVGGTFANKFIVYADGDVFSATNSYTSDRREKENIAAFEGSALEIGRKFNLHTFHRLGYEREELGFIAQDVQAAGYTWAVRERDGRLALDSNAMTALVFGMVRENDNRITALEQHLGLLN